MYQEVSKLEELPVIGGSAGQTSDSDIDLDTEEIRQRKSSQIRFVVLVLIGAGICAVLIAVVLSVVKSEPHSSSSNGYDVLRNMEPLINSSKFFCGPVHGIIDEDTFVFKVCDTICDHNSNIVWDVLVRSFIHKTCVCMQVLFFICTLFCAYWRMNG